MSTSTASYSELKAALKEALVELFQERRELFLDLFKEVIEETGFAEETTSVTTPRPNSPLDAAAEMAVEAEISAFHRLHPTLLEQHPGEFVAIYHQQLVDRDADKLALYQRIQQRYPGQFVLMRRIEKEPERELHFRSTRNFLHAS